MRERRERGWKGRNYSVFQVFGMIRPGIEPG